MRVCRRGRRWTSSESLEEGDEEGEERWERRAARDWRT